MTDGAREQKPNWQNSQNTQKSIRFGKNSKVFIFVSLAKSFPQWDALLRRSAVSLVIVCLFPSGNRNRLSLAERSAKIKKERKKLRREVGKTGLRE